MRYTILLAALQPVALALPQDAGGYLPTTSNVKGNTAKQPATATENKNTTALSDAGSRANVNATLGGTAAVAPASNIANKGAQNVNTTAVEKSDQSSGPITVNIKLEKQVLIQAFMKTNLCTQTEAEAISDEVFKTGGSSNGTASNGTASNGTASNGAASKDADSKDAASKDAASKDAASKDAASKDATVQGETEVLEAAARGAVAAFNIGNKSSQILMVQMTVQAIFASMASTNRAAAQVLSNVYVAAAASGADRQVVANCGKNFVNAAKPASGGQKDKPAKQPKQPVSSGSPAPSAAGATRPVTSPGPRGTPDAKPNEPARPASPGGAGQDVQAGAGDFQAALGELSSTQISEKVKSACPTESCSILMSYCMKVTGEVPMSIFPTLFAVGWAMVSQKSSAAAVNKVADDCVKGVQGLSKEAQKQPLEVVPVIKDTLAANNLPKDTVQQVEGKIGVTAKDADKVPDLSQVSPSKTGGTEAKTKLPATPKTANPGTSDSDAPGSYC